MIHRLLQLASSPEILNVRVSRRPLFKAKMMTLGRLAGQPRNKPCSSERAKRTAVEGKGQEVCVPWT